MFDKIKGQGGLILANDLWKIKKARSLRDPEHHHNVIFCLCFLAHHQYFSGTFIKIH